MLSFARNCRRWSDNDQYFGPFTFALDRKYRPVALVLSSAEEEYPGASLRVSALGCTLITAMPGWLIRPHREKVEAKYWDAATVERLGRDWYWNVDQRSFGFSYSDGFLQVFRGRITHDSSTDRTKGYFMPWRMWRQVRHSVYSADGSFAFDMPKMGGEKWHLWHEARANRPQVSFAFDDFDGERIEARTCIEERERWWGEGRFKWLAWLRPARTERYLDLEFTKEVGKRKGSWKGGTLGHAIVMKPGEMHEAAFRRYCAENSMTFVGAAQ